MQKISDLFHFKFRETPQAKKSHYNLFHTKNSTKTTHPESGADQDQGELQG